MVHGPDPFKDALKRPITTIPPSITTAHHDGGLPSPLFYTLTDDDPPLPSTHTQRLRQNLRERNRFQNDGWTNWEAVQLADELGAQHELRQRLIESAGRKPTSNGKLWICRSTGLLLFEWDDLSEEAL